MMASLGRPTKIRAPIRVLVSVIVDKVAAGAPREEILRNYTALGIPHIDAAWAFAAGLTREVIVALPLKIKASSSKSKSIFQQNTRRSRTWAQSATNEN